jgi:hypothetical protein
MKKARILAAISEILYLIPVILGIVLAISLHKSANQSATGNEEFGEALGIALGAAIAAVLLVVVFIYLFVAVLLLIVKTVQLFVPRSFLSIICIVFDCITFIIHAALTVVAITDFDGVGSIIIFAALTAISVAAFVLNLLTRRAIEDGEIDYFIEKLYNKASKSTSDED